MGNVSVVIVSHSRKLGDGLVDLLRQLAGADVCVVSGSGLGDELGTDAMRVLAAIHCCPRSSDVVVLFDLGSARLSCDMAFDLLEDTGERRVRLADAPLVEGAVAATVEASMGSDLDRVVEAAEGAKSFRKLEEF